MSCPVDHSSVASSSTLASPSACPVDHASIPKTRAEPAECPVDHTTRSSWASFLPSWPSSSPSPPAHDSASPESPNHHANLSTSRETSSIPRGATTDAGFEDAKWVYPSEAQFFAAMARKQHNPQAPDMKVVIPIHNAVNERTWAEIMRWESGRGSETCGGPRLISFKGRPADISPRARVKTWMGCVLLYC
jgi:cytochrome c heme-lyase